MFANLKFHCCEAEYIGFVRLHFNASQRSDSGVIFMLPPEQSEFQSANRSVLYWIDTAQCNYGYCGHDFGIDSVHNTLPKCS